MPSSLQTYIKSRFVSVTVLQMRPQGVLIPSAFPLKGPPKHCVTHTLCKVPHIFQNKSHRQAERTCANVLLNSCHLRDHMWPQFQNPTVTSSRHNSLPKSISGCQGSGSQLPICSQKLHKKGFKTQRWLTKHWSYQGYMMCSGLVLFILDVLQKLSTEISVSGWF